MRWVKIYILCFMAQASLCQDGDFRILSSNISLLNPALIEHDKARLKMGISHRGSLHLPGEQNERFYGAFLMKRWKVNSDRDGIGAELRTIHKSDPSGLYKENISHLHLAYRNYLGQIGLAHHHLYFGTSLGLISRAARNPDYWYGLQYDIESQLVDYTIDNGEVSLSDLPSHVNFDLAVGLAWSISFERGISVSTGFTAAHLKPYNLSATIGSEFRSSRKYSAFLSSNWALNKDLRWSAGSFVSFQGSFVRIDIKNSLTFGHPKRDDFGFQIGLIPRITNHIDGFGLDVISIQTGIEVRQWEIHFAYDVTMSRLRMTDQGRAGFELALTYKLHIERERSAHIY